MNQSASIQQLAHALISQSSPNLSATLELAQHCVRIGEIALAASLYAHASAKHRKNAALKSELAACYLALGRCSDAIPLARKACTLRPDSSRAHFILAEAYRKTGKAEKALTSYQRVLSLSPHDQTAGLGLALCFKSLAKEAEAEEQLLRILVDEPGHLAALHNLANLYKTQDRHEEARNYYKSVLERDPDNVNSLSHLGEINEELALYNEALETYQGVIKLCDDRGLQDQSYQRAVFNQARIDLGMQNFEKGWSGYFMRETLPGHPPNPLAKSTHCTRWEGQALKDKHIILLAEQGLGDEISFASLIPGIYEQAKKCTIECSPELRTLFRTSFPKAEIVQRGALPRDIEFVADYYQFIPNVAQYTRRSVDQFPQKPFLFCTPELVHDWNKKLASLKADLKIGISWKGGTSLTKGSQRSTSLPELLPAFRGLDCELVSLQYGDITHDLKEAKTLGYEIHHWIDKNTALDQVGALCKALDMVITIDTTVAHLSAALGQTTWVMLPLNADWRWSLKGERTPWYPTASLFRKTALLDWSSVVSDIKQELSRFVSKR